MLTSDQVAQRLMQLKNSSSTNTKLELLKGWNDPLLHKVLLYAYDPYRRFGIGKRTLINLKGRGLKQFDIQTWRMLDVMALGHLTGGDAKRVALSMAYHMTPESAAILSGIFAKDLSIGMAATRINEAIPNLIPTFDVMLCRDYDESKIKFPCVVSPKFDGMRGVYKNGRFFSRRGHELIGLEHIKQELLDRNITHCDGELVVPGIDPNTSRGQIRAKAPTPHAILFAFDSPGDLPLDARLTYLQAAVKSCTTVSFVSHKLVTTMEEVRAAFEYCVSVGLEGIVIKDPNLPYTSGDHDWMRLKIQETADLKVAAVYEGEGRLKGKMGGVVCIMDGVSVNIGGGWTDSQRALYWHNPNKIIGKTIEVSFQEKTKDGSLRHPNFERIRHSK